MPRPPQKVIDDFHKGWHESIDGTWHTTRWFGYKVIKCPLDLHIYQELIYRIKPALIIETGTCFGGSALFLAHMLDINGKGRVMTIDIKLPRRRPEHPRLMYITGNSVDQRIVDKVLALKPKNGPVLVILDSDHSQTHVAKEMEIYGDMVTVGSYMIVEDTNLNRLVRKDHGPGPGEAVDAFMEDNHQWVVDLECEKLYMTFNPGGYLKKVK